jgi:hypothetical protein
VSGGDIKNAVLKAAAAAAGEPGIDASKRIHQRHFEQAMEEVVAAKAVMQQSLFGDEGRSGEERVASALEAAEARWRSTALLALALAAAALVAAAGAVGAVLFR